MANVFGDLIPKSAPGSPVKLTNPDRTVLNNLQGQAQSAAETHQQYLLAQDAIRRLQPGPFKGAMLDAALPSEGGGILDKMGAFLIGGPARALGVITDQTVNDFQRLKGLASERVLEGQIAQKGPQTDSDAARLALTEISPYKTPAVNKQVIAAGDAKAMRATRRAPFYTQWANKYGLNGTNEKGQAVEEAFQEYLKHQPGATAATTDGWKVKAVK